MPPPPIPISALQRWRHLSLLLTAASRFKLLHTSSSSSTHRFEFKTRYHRLRTFKISIHAIVAAHRLLCTHYHGFGLTPHTLATLIAERLTASLHAYGGVPGIARFLSTHPSHGIPDASNTELEKRRLAFGDNAHVSKPPNSFLSFVWDACKDVTLVVLFVCAMVSMALGIKTHGVQDGWYDGISILVAVILVVLVVSISDFRQSLQFRDLSEENRNMRVQVTRGGRRQEVSVFDVVVGDVLLLHTGDQVPADGLFVEGHSLCLDESSITGETETVTVDKKMPFIVSGSKVHDGYGSMIVTAVGMRTEWGRLSATLSDAVDNETPLQARLSHLAKFIGYVGTTVALLVFSILLISYFVGHRQLGSNDSGVFRAGTTSATDIANNILDIFVIAVTIFVVAVPEGLPLAVTLTLAYAMKKMVADKALVRRLAACETMGSVTTICSDKTGTLTLNQMNVVSAWAAGKLGARGGDLPNVNDEFRDVLLEGIVNNSSGSVFVPPDGGPVEVMGSSTEKALLQWGIKLGMDYRCIQLRSTVIKVEPFNSDRKVAGVAIRMGTKVRIHWKGAAEWILQNSVKTLLSTSSDGSTESSEITSQQRKDLTQVIEAMANKSLRCIAMGFKDLDITEVPAAAEEEEFEDNWALPGDSLTLLAIVGIKDPCRPEVAEAIQRCKMAGIRVKMITGDNLWTAKAIAAECGILEEGTVAIEGSTFREYSEEMRRQEAPRIAVMARSTPSDKLLMVRTLKELEGEVVAVTGDGTNDAPALREADIGLAMGIQGTDVAKQNSDIVILDDNFATVVKVVRWGRSVYVNIQKFIQFQLTVNVAALTINFVAAVSSGNVPLTAVQLLWVNLIMDTLGALALATESPTDDLLRQPPAGRTVPLVSMVMWRNVLFQAAYQITVLLLLHFRGRDLLGLSGSDASNVNDTIIFNAFVFCQLFNEVNARKLEDRNIFQGLWKNWLFMGILGFSVVFQVIMVEFLNKFASTVKLGWGHWALCIAIGFMSWPIRLVSKSVTIPRWTQS